MQSQEEVAGGPQRTRFTKEQVAKLMGAGASGLKTTLGHKSQRKELANELGVDEQRVKVWLRNNKAKYTVAVNEADHDENDTPQIQVEKVKPKVSSALKYGRVRGLSGHNVYTSETKGNADAPKWSDLSIMQKEAYDERAKEMNEGRNFEDWTENQLGMVEATAMTTIQRHMKIMLDVLQKESLIMISDGLDTSSIEMFSTYTETSYNAWEHTSLPSQFAHIVQTGRIAADDLPGGNLKDNRERLENRVRTRWAIQLGECMRKYVPGMYELITEDGDVLPVPFKNPSIMRVEELKLALFSTLRLVEEDPGQL